MHFPGCVCRNVYDRSRFDRIYPSGASYLYGGYADFRNSDGVSDDV